MPATRLLWSIPVKLVTLRTGWGSSPKPIRLMPAAWLTSPNMSSLRRGSKLAKQAELQELVTRRRQLVDLRRIELNHKESASSKIVRKNVQRMVDLLRKQIAQLDKEILRLIEEDDDWNQKAQLLDSARHRKGQHRDPPGTTSRVGPIEPSEDRWCWPGAVPFNRDSGRFHGKRSIWGGRAAVRSVLYMAAITARTHNPVIREFAKRLEAAGKPFKVVITACMGKLLVILNAMLKNKTKWSPKNCLANA